MTTDYAALNTLTLGNNWLDTAGQITVGNGSNACYTTWTYPTTYWYQTAPQKITLKLSEIERLRAAAKKDKALKEILQKFTGHIEIEVDF